MPRRYPVCVMALRGEAGDPLPEPEWCMAKRQPKELTEKLMDEMSFGSTATACGYHVLLAAGIKRRAPTCPECKVIYKRKTKKR